MYMNFGIQKIQQFLMESSRCTQLLPKKAPKKHVRHYSHTNKITKQKIVFSTQTQSIKTTAALVCSIIIYKLYNPKAPSPETAQQPSKTNYFLSKNISKTNIFSFLYMFKNACTGNVT